MDITIQNNGGVYTLTSKQVIDAPHELVWNFFSKPENLENITPKDLSFQIIFLPEKTFYEGMVITYRIGIFPFIKNNWVTEISKIKNGEYFIDEQRVGPYKMWHHEHHFKKLKDNQIEMTDYVHFKPPLGIFGKIAYTLFIKKKVKQIFEFRWKFIESKFNKKASF